MVEGTEKKTVSRLRPPRMRLPITRHCITIIIIIIITTTIIIITIRISISTTIGFSITGISTSIITVIGWLDALQNLKGRSADWPFPPKRFLPRFRASSEVSGIVCKRQLGQG